MTDAAARIERPTGVMRLLWSNRARILGSTAALGLAAFLAGTLVPPSHRATIRISAASGASAVWDEAMLQGVLAAEAAQTRPERSGVLAVWIHLIDQSSALRPDVGAERSPDGTVVVWAEDHDADDARRRAWSLANQLTDRLGPVQATATVPAPARTASTVQALDDSISKAQGALSAAEARLAEAQRGSAQPNAGSRSTLDADRRAADSARRDLQEFERFAGGLGNAAPSDAPAGIRTSEEWVGWRDAVARREAAALQVADLSRTLLDGHPRMATVRLRLADLDEETSAARSRLAAALERRIATQRREVGRLERRVSEGEAASGEQASAQARVTGAQADAEAARQTLAALEEARRVAGQAEEGPQPSVSAVPSMPAVSTALSETEYRPNIWPIVAGSAAFGFLGSSLYAVLGAMRRRSEVATPERVAAARTRDCVEPTAREPVEPRVSSRAFDITPADELIGGILASEISRVVIVPIGTDERPAAVEIVRRLALRGKQGALVDLSERQLAARAMGVDRDALGISDMIAGDATFAEIARRDFATKAEAFGAGRTTVGEAAFFAMERRNVLEFIERNYDVVLIVSAGLPHDTLKTLLTPDAALVVTVEAEDDDAIAAGVGRLREAGLTDMILADGRQLAS